VKSASSSSASSPSLLTYDVMSNASKEQWPEASSLRLETALTSLALQEAAEKAVGIDKSVDTDGELVRISTQLLRW
jgi:hypothetical protein